MQNPPPVQTGKSSTGLDENVAALLSYVFGWISGLIFLLIEKDSRLVRFHGLQSILLNLTSTVVFVVLWILSTIVAVVIGQVSGALGTIFSLLSLLIFLALGVAFLAAWVMCLIKAYGGQFFKLPILGNFAEKFTAPK